MFIYEILKHDNTLEQWQIDLDETNSRWKITNLTKETIYWQEYNSVMEAEHRLECLKQGGYIKEYMKCHYEQDGEIRPFIMQYVRAAEGAVLKTVGRKRLAGSNPVCCVMPTWLNGRAADL